MPNSRKAKLAPCDSTDVPYAALQLQFASSADVNTMESPGARLVDAASRGDKKVVKELLKLAKKEKKNEKKGVDEGGDDVRGPDARDWDDMTALIAASSEGYNDVVLLLLAEGADPNAHDRDGITALMEASIMGHSVIVTKLIEAGATVDAKSNSDVTALWLAAGGNKLDVMKILLDKGADASDSRSDGTTALMAASVAGHTDVVKLLIENGGDPNAVDKDGLTALMNAAENGSVEVIRTIIENVKDPTYVDTMSTTGFTALIIAAAHGKTDAVSYLIENAKADVNIVHDNKVTTLMYAAASGHADTMKVLIENGGADINALHINGGSALTEAATAGAADTIKFLIENGAKYDLLDDDGVSPLMAVASQGNVTGLDHVLDALKSDRDAQALTEHINLLSHSGGSSVMFAAAGGHTKCAKTLIELGANIDEIAQATPDYLEKLAKMIEEGTVKDDDPHVDGVTAVHVAAQAGHLEVLDLLVENGADVTKIDEEDRTPLLLAVKGNYGEVASSLVKGGADPNTPYEDEEGEDHNLLMDSIIVENKEFSDLLVEKGAEIYHKDKHGVTTLLQAAHRGMAEVVSTLLKAHADGSGGDGDNKGWIDAQSDEGITALIAASSEGHDKVVKLLLDAKANPDAADKDGTNSIMAASARGHTDIVELLIKAGAKLNEQNVDGHTALMFAYNGKNQVETLWERYSQFVTEADVEKSGNLQLPAGTDDIDSSAVATGKEAKKVDDGGTGPIIREALDGHRRMVELLIANGADDKAKDKEGHVALDFDYHPDADAEILEKEAIAEKKRDESKNEL